MIKKIIITFSLFVASSSLIAQDNIEELMKFQTERHKAVVGKQFLAKKDNLYLIQSGLFNYYATSSTTKIKVFLTKPDHRDCTVDNCPRKELLMDASFVVDSIVEPAYEDNGEYTCKSDIILCYYKLKFEDGEYAYMQISDFASAKNPSKAITFESPFLLQIIPKAPDKSWSSDYASFKKHFSKAGVKEGFSQDDVLMSAWGKPISKHRTSSNGTKIEVWAYSGGMLSFLDGFLVSITTTE